MRGRRPTLRARRVPSPAQAGRRVGRRVARGDPLERRGNRLRERPDLQAGGERALDRRLQHRRVRGSCSQSGSSIHSPTSCSTRNSGSTQMSSASEPAARRQVSSRSSRVVGGATALYVPARRSSPAATIQSARSRTSITCAAASGGATARTGPGSRKRCGQYVRRPVGSHGPTISPGRGTNASGKRASTAARTAP